MNKILLAMIVGLFAVSTYAADAAKTEPSKAVAAVKADSANHTAVPVKKAKLLKGEAKKEASATHATTK